MSQEDDPFEFESAEPWQPGDRLRFLGTREFWFTDIVAEAERLLRVGEVYTLKSVRAFSSWTEITLAETGSTPYNDVWFERLPSTPSA